MIELNAITIRSGLNKKCYLFYVSYLQNLLAMLQKYCSIFKTTYSVA